MNPAYAIAVMSSVVFGAADFLGGYAARRASALTVTFASAAIGLVTMGAATVFVRGNPTAQDFAWGVASGVCGGTGVALLFRAFAIGPMSIAAPMISLIALAMPVVVGVALGERPSALAVIGIAFAACSFPLISRSGTSDEPHDPAARRTMLLTAFASGVLVGGFLVCLSRVSPGAGFAPLFTARLTTVVLFGTTLLARRASLWPRGVAVTTLSSGLLDSFANVAYFVAVSRGPLAIVGTIVSLAPATTVMLARLVLREKWSPTQRIGLAFAGAAIVCVSLG